MPACSQFLPQIMAKMKNVSVPRFRLNSVYKLLVMLFAHNSQRKSKVSVQEAGQSQPISQPFCGEEELKPKYLLLRDVKFAVPDMFIIKSSDPEIVKAYYQTSTNLKRFRLDPNRQPLNTFTGSGGLQKEYFIKPLRATAVDIPIDKSNIIISLFPDGIRFWSRIMALFLSAFIHHLAEVNRSQQRQTGSTWYSFLGCIQRDMMIFFFFFPVLKLAHRDKKITRVALNDPEVNVMLLFPIFAF